MDKITRINELLDELAELGKDHYKPEYKDSIPYWQRIGAAISTVTDTRKGILQLAYAVLEDHNAHSLCSLLSWAFPDLDNQGQENFDENKKYLVELKAVQGLINRNNVIVLTDWNAEKIDYDIRHARVTVNVEWLD